MIRKRSLLLRRQLLLVGQGTIGRRQRRLRIQYVNYWVFLISCILVILFCSLYILGQLWLFCAWLSNNPRYRSSILDQNTGSPKSVMAEELPFNSFYKTPHAHKLVGDRSLTYAILRREIDDLLPEDAQRSLAWLNRYQPSRGDWKTVPILPVSSTVHNSDEIHDHISDQVSVTTSAYDVYNCPPVPPPGYPYQWNLLEVIANWNPENTSIPEFIYQGLCVFDFELDYEIAMTYRQAELPFVVKGDARIAATAERWNSPGYLERILGRNAKHRTTRSDSNHFLYAVPPRRDIRRRGHKLRKRPIDDTLQRIRTEPSEPPVDWKEPTESLRMTYAEWLNKANASIEGRSNSVDMHDGQHWYFRLIGCGLMGQDGSCDKESSEYLFDELPFFQPTPGGLYLDDVSQQKGIHCRFGQEGTIADNHFDAARNTIVLLGGSRR